MLAIVPAASRLCGDDPVDDVFEPALVVEVLAEPVVDEAPPPVVERCPG